MAVVETTFRAMASHVHVVVVDGPARAGSVAHRALEQLESAWSRFVDTSDIARMNRAQGQPVLVDPTTITLLDVMTQAWRSTGGRYDPTILRALLSAGYVASIETDQVAAPLPPSSSGSTSSVDDIQLDRANNVVTLPSGMAIDAGGIGKGLAADLVVAELLARGAAGALVSIGGDLAAAGNPPDADGWTVDVEDHLDPSRTLTRLLFSGGGIATSSTQSRRWDHQGRDEHHVIDPATAAPSGSDLAAVTVVGSCGWQAEAHATALLLGGTRDFSTYTRDHGLQAVATALTGEWLATDVIASLLMAEVAS